MERDDRSAVRAAAQHEARELSMTREGGEPMDAATLTELLREAEEHHGPYEATAPKHHWSGWYAAYIIAREGGRSPEEASDDAARHMERVR